ncbi:MAG: DNA adenine methylase [Oscillospiraceae bacterium]|nr:DNA adenine methylase [Oscillospiraceae bacterium]
MNGRIPHIVQYQGSKRKLAPQILRYMPERFERLVEPFSGMAAITIAAAYENRAQSYYVNDLNAPLIALLKEAIEHPASLLEAYSEIWKQQFAYGADHARHFYEVRERFNQGEETPENMLYLLARCVKGAVRYGKDGKFNQSPDKRRHGTTPENLEQNITAISRMLKGKTKFSALDYQEVFDMVKTGDLVYMDPPYQGVTNTRDHRYYSGVSFDEFVKAIELLNRKGVDYLISYDGECGGKEYGKELPESLGCKKIMLNAGVSSQATLLGKKEITFEALYISESLIPVFEDFPRQLTLLEVS